MTSQMSDSRDLPRVGGARDQAGTSLYHRAKRGFPASYPLVQFPNAPLLIALVGLLAGAVTTGELHDYGRAVFLGGLTVWAWLEATEGVNGLRRVLGSAGLAYVLVEVAEALGN